VKLVDAPRTSPMGTMTTCNICQNFITDWLRLPLNQYETTFLRQKTIHTHAPMLAKQFFRIYAKIPAWYRSYIECMQLRKFDTNRNSAEFELQGADGEYLLQAIEGFAAKEEIAILQDLLEDICTVKKGVIRMWIGQWMVKIWDNLHDVHLEHQKLKSVSYAGAAHGMFTYRKATNGMTMVYPPTYRTSNRSLLEISAKFLQPKAAQPKAAQPMQEESKDFDPYA